MKNINYETFAEITVKTQKELDMIPLDFKGRIYIEFGTYFYPAIVKNKYYYRVEACGNSSVVARENSSVVARENSSVEACGNSSVEAWGNSSVVAWGNSSVEACGNSSVVAWGNSSVVARENSSVVARENSSVVARENSSVEARENSSVVARENSSVAGGGNAQICDRLSGGRIEITGNARVVYMPKSIFDYCDFYGLKHDKKSGRFFKCVHKVGEKYYSDHERSFEYRIGENAIPNGFDDSPEEDCGRGIHVSYLAWVLDYGRNWNDLAILEVEADLDGIVVPNGAPGKVRCKKVKVLREVPLEECGVYGKILAKTMKKTNGCS